MIALFGVFSLNILAADSLKASVFGPGYASYVSPNSTTEEVQSSASKNAPRSTSMKSNDDVSIFQGRTTQNLLRESAAKYNLNQPSNTVNSAPVVADDRSGPSFTNYTTRDLLQMSAQNNNAATASAPVVADDRSGPSFTNYTTRDLLQMSAQNNNAATTASASVVTSACEDSDGADYFTRGITQIKDGSSVRKSFVDEAVGTGVIEYLCTNRGVEAIYVQCPNGVGNGACKEKQTQVQQTQPSIVAGVVVPSNSSYYAQPDTNSSEDGKNICTDSDGGLTEGFFGTVSGELNGTSFSYKDLCQSPETLIEWRCDLNGIPRQTGYTCPNGCADGACLAQKIETKPTIVVEMGKWEDRLKAGKTENVVSFTLKNTSDVAVSFDGVVVGAQKTNSYEGLDSFKGTLEIKGEGSVPFSWMTRDDDKTIGIVYDPTSAMTYMLEPGEEQEFTLTAEVPLYMKGNLILRIGDFGFTNQVNVKQNPIVLATSGTPFSGAAQTVTFRGGEDFPEGELFISEGSGIYSEILVSNMNDREILQVRLNAKNDDVLVSDLYFENDWDNNEKPDHEDVYERLTFNLSDGRGTLFQSKAMEKDGTLHFHLEQPIVVPKDGTYMLLVSAGVAPITDDEETDEMLRLSLDTDHKTKGVEARSAMTGDEIKTPSKGWGEATSSQFLIHKSRVNITHANTQPNFLDPTTMPMEIYRFTVYADGEAELGRVTLDLTFRGLVAKNSNFMVKEVTPSGNIEMGSIVGSVRNYMNSSGTHGHVALKFENQKLSAGESRTYALLVDNLENVGIAPDDDEVKVAFVRDTQYKDPNTKTGISSPVSWSDMSARGHSDNTKDWFNSYLLQMDTSAMVNQD